MKESVDTSTYVPDFEISFNEIVQSDLKEFVTSISINEKIGGEPAQFTIVLADNFDPVSQKFLWLEQFLSLRTSPLFVKDKLINISMGYVGILKKMISGKLENISTTGFSSDISRLTLGGFDKSHKYLTNPSIDKKDQIELTQKETYTSIAKKLAEKLLIRSVTDPTNQYKNVTMKNYSTYMDFLKDGAKRTGYSFFISRDELYFVNPRKERTDKNVDNLVYKWHDNLIEFTPQIDFANLVQKVETRGTTTYSRELVKKSTEVGQENLIESEKNNTKILTGSQIAKLRGNKKIEVTNVNFNIEQEATDLSNAYLNIINDNLITATCSVVGNPIIKPGAYVTIIGVGRHLSGKYLVTDVTNTIDTGGYTTKFNVSRNSITVGD